MALAAVAARVFVFVAFYYCVFVALFFLCLQVRFVWIEMARTKPPRLCSLG